MPRNVKVEQDPNNNLKDIVILQKTIVEMAEAAKKFNASGLKRRAVVVLLQDIIGQKRISREQISDVLDAAEQLAKVYIKQEGEKEDL